MSADPTSSVPPVGLDADRLGKMIAIYHIAAEALAAYRARRSPLPTTDHRP